MRTLLLSLSLLTLLGACGESTSSGSQSEPSRGQATPSAGSAAQVATANLSAASPPAQDLRAPDTFTVRLDTTKGEILIDVTRAWSPRGADRFYTLVRAGYYERVAFFRVVEGFMAQVGIHGTPAVNRAWRSREIPDDPVVQSNTRGMVSYAMAGPGTRTTQFFINYVDRNSRLDSMGFAPFGRVRDMSVVDALYSGYGEGAPRGRGPSQPRMMSEGNTYLESDFPELDYINSASIVGE